MTPFQDELMGAVRKIIQFYCAAKGIDQQV
jgi:hypothetical protein